MDENPKLNEAFTFILYYFGYPDQYTDKITLNLHDFATMLEPRIGKQKADALCGLTIYKSMKGED